ncbi:MAG: hypothetical protein K0R18_2118 [Bacillales bacterium]|nr:hypothetical protein [Bacillales bacterium]
MKEFMNLDIAKKEIEKAKEYIAELNEYIDLIENYTADTDEKRIILEYAISGNTKQVADKLNEAGFRFENRREFDFIDVSRVIKWMEPIDRLHSIVQSIQKMNLDMTYRLRD